MINKKRYIKKYKCIGCGYIGGIYDFSPSIQISENNFRIFHMYNQMKGPLFCNQCKRKHLLKIAQIKNISKEEIEFLKNEIKKREKEFSHK